MSDIAVGSTRWPSTRPSGLNYGHTVPPTELSVARPISDERRRQFVNQPSQMIGTWSGELAMRKSAWTIRGRLAAFFVAALMLAVVAFAWSIVAPSSTANVALVTSLVLVLASAHAFQRLGRSNG